tara:strand:- start:342 stop:1346 length:1005 start_codon:yes stop_codon:yes gene_type:complete
MIYIFILYLLILLIFTYKIINKKKFNNDNILEHQTFINQPVPLVGGIYLLLPIFFLFYENYLMMLFIYFILFLLGLLSDFNFLSSAKKRFLIQILVVLFFVFFIKLEVTSTRIDFVDNLFNNPYISYTFTAFCLLILINGANFIDGLNGLLLGYFLLIMFFIFKLDLLELLISSNKKIILFIIFCIFLLILNYFNKIFMGDNGAYSLGFIFGFVLIKIYNLNQNISPYFIILLLWYPCFEIFFSLIRKIFQQKNPLNPDNEHLHHYVFSFLKNKFKISSIRSNNFSSVLINSYNLFLFYIASTQIYNTGFQLILLFTSVSIYVLIYSIFRYRST